MWRRGDYKNILAENLSNMIIKAWITKMQEATKTQQKQHIYLNTVGFKANIAYGAV